MARFIVVISRDDGGVEVHPMKEWLRQHPQHVPASLDATASTSHQLRNALKRAGWLAEGGTDEVRLIPPGTDLSRANLDALLGSESDAPGEDVSEAAFALEFQLRDFIAQNMPSIDFDGRRLKLYIDDAGRDGVEYPTAVRQIDILAVDEHGHFYVSS